jgi:acetylornithine deacetylase/succinyl-diaminopimelate desuccinylase-like protein
VIIGEHSGLRIVTDSKGMITATLRAVGRSGHSAYPWRGDNALIKLQTSLANLLAAYPPATEEAWRTTVNLARIQTPNQARNQDPRPGRGMAGHPLPGRRHQPERQDHPADRRLPGVVLRARRHPRDRTC